MELTLLSRRVGTGEGASGYAAGLVRGLRDRGVRVRLVPSRRGPLGYALRTAAIWGPVLSLERTLRHDVFRAGGGVHRAYRRAMGIRRPGAEDWLERRAVGAARWVVANSAMVADQLHRELGVPWGRIEVVRTGVDGHAFAPGRERSPAVLFVGHGWRRKGFDVAVEAAARVGAELWVAGRDAQRARRLRRAARRVRLRDLGERVELARVFPRVAAVVHPTRYDAASNVVLEALACGTPVVTSRMDGSAEIVPDALVAPDPTDAAVVARCLRIAMEWNDPTGLRSIADTWPASRNHERMHELLMRCVDG